MDNYWIPAKNGHMAQMGKHDDTQAEALDALYASLDVEVDVEDYFA